jgi:hypothetical protein
MHLGHTLYIKLDIFHWSLNMSTDFAEDRVKRVMQLIISYIKEMAIFLTILIRRNSDQHF